MTHTTSAGDVPEWALVEAAREFNECHPTAQWTPEMLTDGNRGNAGFRATMLRLARYIAAHEEPPVDPLLIEAREIAALAYQDRRDHDFAAWIRKGDKDSIFEVQVALKGLRRGIALASEPQP